MKPYERKRTNVNANANANANVTPPPLNTHKKKKSILKKDWEKRKEGKASEYIMVLKKTCEKIGLYLTLIHYCQSK